MSQAGLSGQPVTHTHHEFDTAGGVLVPGSAAEEMLATLGYLGVIFFGFVPALIIYLSKGRSAPYVRYHCARAVNVSVTLLLFDVCALIVGGMLAFDAVTVSLSVIVPLVTLLWLVTLAYIVRTAFATARGEPYELPRWLRADLLR
jgi:uncharacterized protein